MKLFYLFLLFILFPLYSCKKESRTTLSAPKPVEFADISTDEANPEGWEINDDEDVQKYLDATGNYPDGTYCAEVEYYNPNTGTRRTYDLDVEVENGDLTQIDWPNGGWLDSTHFSPEDISTGEVSFKSDRGYRYTVTLDSFGGGCSGGYSLRNTVNSEVEQENEDAEEERVAETCPECGGSKSSYDEICYSCKIKQEREENEQEDVY